MTAPCCERDHDADGNCDRHPEPGTPHAERLAAIQRATPSELAGMAEHSRVQNVYRALPNFGASRSIMGRYIEVVFDGRRLGTVTIFNAQRELASHKRKQRSKGSPKLTVPGWGNMGFDKVNSAWARFIEENNDLSGFTMRVTVSDPGMPNPEVTEYRGVKINTFADMTALTDITTQAVEFTFEDSEVIRPVEETRNERLDGVWEYDYSTGFLLADTSAPV